MAITILALLCMLCVAVLLQKVAVNPSPTLEQMLLPQDRDQINYPRQLFEVESDPMLVAILSPVSRLSPERLSEFESTLQAIEGVASVFTAAALREQGLGDVTGFGIKDNAELMLLLLEPGTQDLQTSKALSERIRQSVEALLTADESVLITGLQQVRAASWDITKQDLKIMLPLLVVLTIVITWLLFHSYTALALSLLLASLTTAICLGGHILLRAELNMLIILVIPVIWAIATLDAFHLYSRSAIKIAEQDTTPIETASRELFIPCLLTTVTTAACFLTLTLLDTSPLITTLGIWGAAGAVAAFALTFTVGIKLLSINLFHRPATRWPGRLCVQIVTLARQHRKPVILFWLAGLVISIILLPGLQIASPFPQVFTPDRAIAVEINQLKSLTDTDLNALDIIIETDAAEARTIQNLASAALLTRNYLHTIDETRLVLPVDLIDSESRQRLIDQWQSTERLQENTTLADTPGLEYWIDPRSHTVRLQAFMAESSFARKQEIFDWLRHFDDTMLSRHKVSLSGAAYFHHRVEQQGLNSLLYSSLLCLLIVALTLLWITREYVRALIALCASIIPASMMAAAMVILDIPWSITLLPLPAILLGLMADDTIHVLWFSRRSERVHEDRFQHNARMAGPALLATTLVLAGASATLMLSGLQANQYLGMLIPAALLMAFLCNLSLLPALNCALHRSTQSMR